MNSPGACQVSIFLLLKTKYDPYTAIAETLFLKHLNLISPFQNLCSLAKTCLLSLDMYPVCDPTSNGFTETLYLVISEEKCWYFSSFKLCAIEILDSLGTVNSKISRLFDFLSTITISGFKVVTNISGGIVPPLCV